MKVIWAGFKKRLFHSSSFLFQKIRNSLPRSLLDLKLGHKRWSDLELIFLSMTSWYSNRQKYHSLTWFQIYSKYMCKYKYNRWHPYIHWLSEKSFHMKLCSDCYHRQISTSYTRPVNQKPLFLATIPFHLFNSTLYCHLLFFCLHLFKSRSTQFKMKFHNWTNPLDVMDDLESPIQHSGWFPKLSTYFRIIYLNHLFSISTTSFSVTQTPSGDIFTK